MKSINTTNSRRKFIGSIAATASLTGLAPLMAGANPQMAKPGSHPAEDWFKNIKGSHRIVYDGPAIHQGFPIIWPWAFYLSNNQTGTPDNDMTAVVVLRHDAIPLAMKDSLWQKYNFGTVFSFNDASGKARTRNPYYEPKEGDMPMPVIEGIKKQQERGIMYCVCELAISVYSANIAQSMGLNPEEVKKEWVEGVHPGIEIVPSGVWALGRAQEHGCGYIYAGG